MIGLSSFGGSATRKELNGHTREVPPIGNTQVNILCFIFWSTIDG